MSANNAEPTGEAINPDEPILGDNGVVYDSYASDGDTNKSASAELDFDSEDIKKRKKTEYFVNIQGAERIKREEARRQAIEEKRRFAELNRIDAKMRNESVQANAQNFKGEEAELREISKINKKREKAEKRRSRTATLNKNIRSAIGATIRQLFGGKKKFIWLGSIVVIALGVGGYFLYTGVIEPARLAEIQKTTAKNAYVGTDDALEAEDVIGKVEEMQAEGASADDVLNYVQGEIDKSNREGSKQILQTLYWRVYGYEKDGNKAIEELKKVANNSKLSYVKESAYRSIYLLYKRAGNNAEAENYAKKAQEYES